MILMKTSKNPSLSLSKERVVSISLQAQGTEGESPKGNCHGGEREPQLGGGEWRRKEERGRENSGEWRKTRESGGKLGRVEGVERGGGD